MHTFENANECCLNEHQLCARATHIPADVQQSGVCTQLRGAEGDTRTLADMPRFTQTHILLNKMVASVPSWFVKRVCSLPEP